MRFSLSERTFRFGSGLDMSQALVTHEIVGAFQMNQYLIGCTSTGKAAMIDPGDATASHGSEQIFDFDVQHILLTHGHRYHIWNILSARINKVTMPCTLIVLLLSFYLSVKT